MATDRRFNVYLFALSMRDFNNICAALLNVKTNTWRKGHYPLYLEQQTKEQVEWLLSFTYEGPDTCIIVQDPEGGYVRFARLRKPKIETWDEVRSLPTMYRSSGVLPINPDIGDRWLDMIDGSEYVYTPDDIWERVDTNEG